MREITVGVVAPAYVNVPLWVAQRRGFLAARGLHATERILGTTHGVTGALRNGEVDIALTAPEGSIADAVAGGPLRVVAGLIDRPPLSMIALPAHRTFSDLRGGRIGTSSLTEGTRHVAEAMLAAHGLTLSGRLRLRARGLPRRTVEGAPGRDDRRGAADDPVRRDRHRRGLHEPRAGDRGIRTERRLRQPGFVRTAGGDSFPASACRGDGMVPRPHGGGSGHRRRAHLDRAALRAARLSGPDSRRRYPAGPAVGASGPGRRGRRAAARWSYCSTVV